jgi:uncharacterized protein
MCNPPFYVTHSGIKVDPSNLSTLEISLKDIAHHLTNIQRFGGALPFHVYYSVAQHSILMAEYASVRHNIRYAALCILHDAAEAYLGDVVSPLKRQLDCYKELEEQVEKMIYSKYGLYDLHLQVKDTIKVIDRRILLDETRDLLPDQYDLFKSLYSDIEPLNIRTNDYMTKYEIERKFLSMCKKFGIGD